MEEKSNRKVNKQLRVKAQEILSNRRNMNMVLEILQMLERENNTIPGILTLEIIFQEVLKRREMYTQVIPLEPSPSIDPEEQYKMWLRNVYDQTWLLLLKIMTHGKTAHRIQAVQTLFKLIASEGAYPIVVVEEGIHYFPEFRLKAILTALLSTETNMATAINKLADYAHYTDVLFYTWKYLNKLVAKSKPPEMYVKNFLGVIDKLPVDFNRDKKTSEYLSRPSQWGGEQLFFDKVSLKRWINKVWSCVLHWDLTEATLRQALVVLLERIMPHIDKPLLLTDFLMDSLDHGGPISLLALQGVFTLIQKHNLNYPNIFSKLYAMFEPEIFHTKYKARLFYLSDIFLSSTYVPESLVAAFVKRLARLALIAPPEDIYIICLFIGNLLIRHPGLKRLVNHQQNTTASSDPFIMEESDPYKSNALESSLWEMQSLQNHGIPLIASVVSNLFQPMPSVEWDMCKYLEQNADELFQKEIKKAKEIYLSHVRPEALALRPGEKLIQYWDLM